MTGRDHGITFEELMAWRDGELQGADAQRVQAHVSGCDACQRMEADLAQVSQRLATWQVPAAPASLEPQRRRIWRVSRAPWMQLAAMVLLVAGGAAAWQFARDDAPGQSTLAVSVGGAEAGSYHDRLPRAAVTESAQPIAAEEALSQKSGEAIAGGAGPLLVRMARLSLVPRDFDSARSEMERIVTAAGGFTGRITVSDAQRGARSLSAMLRIPAAKLDETLTALRALGHVTSESQDGEDVTQQSVDLDARLVNARASEVRLKDILDRRTGRLSDVLEVERELSRVRGEIERMEAQRKSLDRRIAYASLTIEMQEERKAAVDLGPQPISTRLRNALVDGWTAAVTSALEATVGVVRIAPLLILWSLVLAGPAWLIKRRFL